MTYNWSSDTLCLIFNYMDFDSIRVIRTANRKINESMEDIFLIRKYFEHREKLKRPFYKELCFRWDNNFLSFAGRNVDNLLFLKSIDFFEGVLASMSLSPACGSISTIPNWEA